MTKQEAQNILANIKRYMSSGGAVDRGANKAIDMAIEALGEQPERAKGHWIAVDSYTAFGGDYATWMAHGNPIAYHYCSNCKQQARADEEGKDILSDFCPDCGADMRGE